MRNINLNRNRLIKGYDLKHIFRESTYNWPGDTEGRALLAFVSHYKIDHFKISWMDEELKEIPKRINKKGYFGKELDLNEIDEQQLAGHSWLLRGLLEHYKVTKDENSYKLASKIVKNLFLPIKNHVKNYPINRKNIIDGGVSGNSNSVLNGWKLSTDIGCVFISLDGLSQFYEISKDKDVRELILNLVEIYKKIDFLGLKAQTHATLTALRGILRFNEIEKDLNLFKLVEEMFDFYVKNGMTLTYENYNWFDRKDTWTEPCAVVDSLILAIKLLKITNDKKYYTLSRRIWFNGLNFCLRNNGGAGPNTCVTSDQPILKTAMYEAYFCCTMRYAEGLYFYYSNKDIFTFNKNANEEVDVYNRHFKDDVLIVKNDIKSFLLSDIKLKNKKDYLNTNFLILY